MQQLLCDTHKASYVKHNVITFVFFRVAVVLFEYITIHYPLGHPFGSRVNFVCV